MSSSSSSSNMFADWELKRIAMDDEQNHLLVNSNFFTSVKPNDENYKKNIGYYQDEFDKEIKLSKPCMILTLKELENAFIEAALIPPVNRVFLSGKDHDTACEYGFGGPNCVMSKYSFDFDQLAKKFDTSMEDDAIAFQIFDGADVIDDFKQQHLPHKLYYAEVYDMLSEKLFNGSHRGTIKLLVRPELNTPPSVVDKYPASAQKAKHRYYVEYYDFISQTVLFSATKDIVDGYFKAVDVKAKAMLKEQEEEDARRKKAKEDKEKAKALKQRLKEALEEQKKIEDELQALGVAYVMTSIPDGGSRSKGTGQAEAEHFAKVDRVQKEREVAREKEEAKKKAAAKKKLVEIPPGDKLFVKKGDVVELTGQAELPTTFHGYASMPFIITNVTGGNKFTLVMHGKEGDDFTCTMERADFRKLTEKEYDEFKKDREKNRVIFNNETRDSDGGVSPTKGSSSSTPHEVTTTTNVTIEKDAAKDALCLKWHGDSPNTGEKRKFICIDTHIPLFSSNFTTATKLADLRDSKDKQTITETEFAEKHAALLMEHSAELERFRNACDCHLSVNQMNDIAETYRDIADTYPEIDAICKFVDSGITYKQCAAKVLATPFRSFDAYDYFYNEGNDEDVVDDEEASQSVANLLKQAINPNEDVTFEVVLWSVSLVSIKETIDLYRKDRNAEAEKEIKVPEVPKANVGDTVELTAEGLSFVDLDAKKKWEGEITFINHQHISNKQLPANLVYTLKALKGPMSLTVNRQHFTLVQSKGGASSSSMANSPSQHAMKVAHIDKVTGGNKSSPDDDDEDEEETTANLVDDLEKNYLRKIKEQEKFIDETSFSGEKAKRKAEKDLSELHKQLNEHLAPTRLAYVKANGLKVGKTVKFINNKAFYGNETGEDDPEEPEDPDNIICQSAEGGGFYLREIDENGFCTLTCYPAKTVRQRGRKTVQKWPNSWSEVDPRHLFNVVNGHQVIPGTTDYEEGSKDNPMEMFDSDDEGDDTDMAATPQSETKSPKKKRKQNGSPKKSPKKKRKLRGPPKSPKSQGI